MQIRKVDNPFLTARILLNPHSLCYSICYPTPMHPPLLLASLPYYGEGTHSNLRRGTSQVTSYFMISYVLAECHKLQLTEFN